MLLPSGGERRKTSAAFWMKAHEDPTLVLSPAEMRRAVIMPLVSTGILTRRDARRVAIK